ncbi:MAG: homocysteine S-methyltransferase family protein [bacterium]
MKKIAERINSGTVLVADGAWGTMLHGEGLAPGDCPELWCIDHRASVLKIARSYVEAGADLIKTNSFGASRFKLEVFGLAARAAELNRAAASISREAAGPDRHVIASIGPTGKLLIMGDVSEQEMFDAFAEQAVALEQGGADACLIETMSALDEASIAIRAARENTRLEILCTFTFERNDRGEYRTMMGVSPAEMAGAISGAGADIIGTNCGNGLERMIPIIRELRATAPAKPVIVNANAGAPIMRAGKTVFPDTPAAMAALIPGVIAAGASIVGGCCGTTPAHIAAIRAAVGATPAP